MVLDAMGTDSEMMEEMIEETTEDTAGGAVEYPTSLEASGLSGVAEAVG